MANKSKNVDKQIIPQNVDQPLLPQKKLKLSREKLESLIYSQRMRSWTLQSGDSLKTAAKKLGVTPQHLSTLLNGRSGLSLDFVEKFVDIYGGDTRGYDDFLLKKNLPIEKLEEILKEEFFEKECHEDEYRNKS